jgi:hypothetical protein
LSCPELFPLKRNKSLCFVLPFKGMERARSTGVELARSARCFTPEDVNGKAPVLGMGTGVGMDMGMSFMRQPLTDQKRISRDGQIEAVAPTCSLCRWDLQDEGSRLLPCQHLLCKDCFQGLIQEQWHVASVHGTVPDGEYKCTTSAPPTEQASSCFIKTDFQV